MKKNLLEVFGKKPKAADPHAAEKQQQQQLQQDKQDKQDKQQQQQSLPKQKPAKSSIDHEYVEHYRVRMMWFASDWTSPVGFGWYR